MRRARWRTVGVQAVADEWSSATEPCAGERGGKSPSSVRGIGPAVWEKHPSAVMARLSARREHVRTRGGHKRVDKSTRVDPRVYTSGGVKGEKEMEKNVQNE